MATTLTVGMAEAKSNFSKLTADANQTGLPFVVFKNNKPWAEVRPLACEDATAIPAETADAMAQADALIADPNHTVYKTAESVFAALGL